MGVQMADATYVLYAPKAQASGLRSRLKSEFAEKIHWRERRRLFGSEFYVSGPSRQAREAHESMTLWLSRREPGL